MHIILEQKLGRTMKKNCKNLVMALLIALMLELTCCISWPKKEKKEINVEVIHVTDLPDIYFPTVPEPKEDFILLDWQYTVLKDENDFWEYAVIPRWYCELVLRYFEENEAAISEYEALQHPP